MSARTKVARLLGALLVALALLPWLGASPASAGGADRGSAHDKGNNGSNGNAAAAQSAHGASKADKPAKASTSDKVDKANEAGKADKNEKAAKAGSAAKPAAPPAAPQAERPAAKPQDAANAAKSSGTQKVTLCHRTNSETNPYVRITVSISSVVKSSGHDGHNGPVFRAGLKAAKIKWGDIIPSFTYTTKSGSSATYAGRNWPAGSAIFNAGCSTPTQPTSTSSSTPSTSTSVSPSTSTSTSVSPSSITTTPSSPPSVIPTITPSEPSLTPSDTAPPSTDTSVLPTKIGTPDSDGDDGDDETVVVLGTKTGPLAATGLHLPLGVLIALSVGLLLIGGALIGMPARAEAEKNRRH